MDRKAVWSAGGMGYARVALARNRRLVIVPTTPSRLTLDDSTIARLRPFAALDAEAQRALAGIGRLAHYRDGDIVLLEGDLSTEAHFVLSGAIRVFRTNLEGREQTVILLREGEALNLPNALARQPMASASASAVGEVCTLVLPAAGVQAVVLRHPAVGLALLQVLAARVQHLSVLAYDLGLLSVRARLARFLLAERTTGGETPERWTHAQIAARVGSVRVVVSRTLSYMAEEGLIRLDRQRIEIVDTEALKRVAEL